MKIGYTGVIIEESLTDNRILNDFMIQSVRVTGEDSSQDRWHIYLVLALDETIDIVAKNIKPGWYAHFKRDKKVIVVFNDAKFVLDFSDKSTWKEAIEHGIAQGIRPEQLDFRTE